MGAVVTTIECVKHGETSDATWAINMSSGISSSNEIPPNAASVTVRSFRAFFGPFVGV